MDPLRKISLLDLLTKKDVFRFLVSHDRLSLSPKVLNFSASVFLFPSSLVQRLYIFSKLENLFNSHLRFCFFLDVTPSWSFPLSSPWSLKSAETYSDYSPFSMVLYCLNEGPFKNLINPRLFSFLFRSSPPPQTGKDGEETPIISEPSSP